MGTWRDLREAAALYALPLLLPVAETRAKATMAAQDVDVRAKSLMRGRVVLAMRMKRMPAPQMLMRTRMMPLLLQGRPLRLPPLVARRVSSSRLSWRV